MRINTGLNSCELYSRGNWTSTDADSMKIFPKTNTSKAKVILPYVSNYVLQAYTDFIILF